MEQQDTTMWQADDLHALADLLADLTPAGLPSEHLDQLEALERIKAAVAAAQVVVAATFADACDSEDVPTRGAAGRRTPSRAMSIGAEVALATLASPHAGEQRVLLSRRLRDDLPHTLAALGRGELSEDRAFAVAREVAHLTPEQRREVDVTSRALDDGTGRLVAVLPLEVLAGVRAALDTAAATARADGDSRTAGQVRADTLAARITGLDPVTETPDVKVNLVIGVESLFGDGTEPGLIHGLGFLPAALCTDLVRHASAAAKATLRRLFATPGDRALVGMESTSRRFEGLLAEFLDIRDGGTCRTLGCNAPIRHLDHVRSAADGGTTTATNGQGLCERCNYVKETPGWTTWTPETSPDGPHEVHGVTAHLRLTRSTSPPLPGGPAGSWDYSPLELQLASNFTLIS